MPEKTILRLTAFPARTLFHSELGNSGTRLDPRTMCFMALISITWFCTSFQVSSWLGVRTVLSNFSLVSQVQSDLSGEHFLDETPATGDAKCDSSQLLSKNGNLLSLDYYFHKSNLGEPNSQGLLLFGRYHTRPLHVADLTVSCFSSSHCPGHGSQRCHRKRARDPCPGQWLLKKTGDCKVSHTKWTLSYHEMVS